MRVCEESTNKIKLQIKNETIRIVLKLGLWLRRIGHWAITWLGLPRIPTFGNRTARKRLIGPIRTGQFYVLINT